MMIITFDIKLKWRTDNTNLKIMSVLLSGSVMPFFLPSQESDSSGEGKYIQYRFFCPRGKPEGKLNKTENERRKKIICSLVIACRE